MNIIAISICVNYSDILYYNIEQNSKFFKHQYIITSPEDVKTINLVQEKNLNNVEILIYNNFYNNNCRFNFGGSRLFAQNYIDLHYNDANILFIDSDIYLPDNFLDKLPNVLKNDTLYGTSERLYYWSLTDYNNNINPHYYGYGNKFAGFFQLFKQSKYKYNDSHNCSECDITFRNLFRKRIHLDLSVKHLGQEGVNWNGRDFTKKI